MAKIQGHQSPKTFQKAYAKQEPAMTGSALIFLIKWVSVSEVFSSNHIEHYSFAAMIKQFLCDVAWGERDYLIVDTPPGTTDEHITVVEQLRKIRLDGAVLVTTPQVSTLNFSK